MENEILKDIILNKIIRDFDFKNNQDKVTHKHFLYKAIAHINLFGRRGCIKLVRKFNTIDDTKTQLLDWKKKMDFLVTHFIGIEKITFKTFIKRNYYNVIYTVFHKKNLLF